MTHNERVQLYIAEGNRASRAARMPVGLEADYCAVHLAKKLASRDEASVEKFSAIEHERLADWSLENMDYARDVFADITASKLNFLLKKGEFSLGEYLISKLTEAMLYDLESQAAEPCNLAEDDMRERLRDYKVEELGVW